MAQEVGMDVDVVRDVASKLEIQAQRLTSAIAEIDVSVSQVQQTWVGHDAEDFIGWWRNQHRPALLQAEGAVSGLAQSARKNAADQDQTSGAVGSAGSNAPTARSMSNDSVSPLGGMTPQRFWRLANDVPVLGSVLTGGAALYDLGKMVYDIHRYGFDSNQVTKDSQQGVIDSTNFVVGLVPFLSQAIAIDDAGGVISDSLLGTDTTNTFSPGYYLEATQQ